VNYLSVRLRRIVTAFHERRLRFCSKQARRRIDVLDFCIMKHPSGIGLVAARWLYGFVKFMLFREVDDEWSCTILSNSAN
jgi:hypothetical protein